MNTDIQQQNDDSKKRTRVTPAQLTVLEETFSLSATPDSKMRKQLAHKLQMPERSIQIWFQNRRAKVKMLQKRAILRQEQEAARARLCAEASYIPYWHPYKKLPVQRAWSTDMVIPPPPHPPQSASMLSFDPLFTLSPSPQSSMRLRMESEPIQDTSSLISNPGLILASSVTIGTWHRMKINQQDLLCFYNLYERTFSWHIRDSNYHFKMMVSFDTIAAIELKISEENQISAQIDIDLLEPPIFFMENTTNHHWVQCSDFTESTQASVVLRHTIRGLTTDLLQAIHITMQDPKLRLVTTQFPSPQAQNLMSTTPLDFSNPHWRHQSVPIDSTSKDFWMPPPTTPYHPI